eukprot:TRINITY_DN110290_c0_g1_i1.p1 TRINITY_DN110290_c0_g1~~TRINITY_DN110290_c0_g1_i1.p1  ORF type:complete len:472 (+),score=110.34 TRINITY_DN110290_c0_g1_i1:60-1418(+)
MAARVSASHSHGASQRDRRQSQIKKRPAQTNGSVETKKNEGPELIIDCKYGNELPKPPVPKLLRAMPSIARLCKYQPTSLELQHRPVLLCEQGLLSRVEIVDPNAYGEAPAPGSMMPPPPPLDAQLLKDDDVPEEVREAAKKRRKLTNLTEAWHRQAFGLQVPQLVTNDVFTERQRYTVGLNAPEKKMQREAPGHKSVEELAVKIETTFEEAAKDPVHPTNPNLKAKRILPIVPDTVLWGNEYVQIVFDEMPKGHDPTMNDVLFRTTPNPRTTCFGFFTPENPEDAGEAGAYKLAQNYYWDNRGGFTTQAVIGEGDAIMLSIPPPGKDGENEGDQEARFVNVPTALKLKKQKAHTLELEIDTHALSVSLRDPSAQEDQRLQERMNQVMNDEITRDHSEASLDYVDGEWVIRGDPRSQSGRSQSGRDKTSMGARSPALPLALTPGSPALSPAP